MKQANWMRSVSAAGVLGLAALAVSIPAVAEEDGKPPITREEIIRAMQEGGPPRSDVPPPSWEDIAASQAKRGSDEQYVPMTSEEFQRKVLEEAAKYKANRAAQ